MSRSYKYAVAQFAADQLRNERLNLGIVVFNDDGLDVRLPRSLDKLRAISAALNISAVREAVEQLPEVYSFILSQGVSTPQEGLAELASLAAVNFSPLGEFFAATKEQYDKCLDRLLHTLVEPEPAPQRESQRRSSKLLTDVKSAFKAERVLALKGEDLNTHRIVVNHKIAEGLPADFLLKNGAMHVVQTVDAATNLISPKRTIQSIAVSALVFEQAKMTFGNDITKSNLVYRASSSLESIISPSLDAAEHQGANLINWESRDDRIRFIIELSSLAEPLADVIRSGSRINASVQPKFRLN